MCQIQTQSRGHVGATLTPAPTGRSALAANAKASTSGNVGGRGSRHFEESNGGYTFTTTLLPEDSKRDHAPKVLEVSVILVDTSKLLVLAESGYKRMLTLPHDGNWSGIKASCINGVLRVTVPRGSPQSVKVPCQVLGAQREPTGDLGTRMENLHLDPLAQTSRPPSSGAATEQRCTSASTDCHSEDLVPYKVDLKLPAHPSVKIIEVQVYASSVGVEVTWCYDQSHQIRRARFPYALGDDLNLKNAHAFLDPVNGNLSLEVPRKEQPRVCVRLDVDSDKVSRGSEATGNTRQSDESIILFSEQLSGLTADDLHIDVVGRELRINVLKLADSWESSWRYANLNKSVVLPSKLKDINTIRAYCIDDELRVVVPCSAMRRPQLRRVHVCTTTAAKFDSDTEWGKVSGPVKCCGVVDIPFATTTLERRFSRSSCQKAQRAQPYPHNMRSTGLQRTQSLRSCPTELY